MESAVLVTFGKVEKNMSLLSEAMTACTLLVERKVQGTSGGYTRTWVDGDKFDAAIVFDSSMQGRRAEKEGVTSLYTVTTDRGRVLYFHDVFRRESDGKVFRVTSDGDDRFTPASAGLNMRQVSAEEWKLT